jgi:hypothetical protein
MIPNKVMAMNDPIKTAVIFGTRPEAIKLAPLIRRMVDAPGRFLHRFWNILPDVQPARSHLPVLDKNIFENRLLFDFPMDCFFKNDYYIKL